MMKVGHSCKSCASETNNFHPQESWSFISKFLKLVQNMTNVGGKDSYFADVTPRFFQILFNIFIGSKYPEYQRLQGSTFIGLKIKNLKNFKIFQLFQKIQKILKLKQLQKV